MTGKQAHVLTSDPGCRMRDPRCSVVKTVYAMRHNPAVEANIKTLGRSLCYKPAISDHGDDPYVLSYLGSQLCVRQHKIVQDKASPHQMTSA
mmetsp:Transcript_9663/g.35416  ORF Transcript_9663/g.35416 Transcript_9663/m.35416 type:complete len:92 (+) Transcript_9663:2046-2321(+)